ncbi:adenosine deaminase [Entamoeba marina]
MFSPHLFKQLPKADLHRHFDGCVRPETLLSIANEQHIELPTYDEAELKKLVMMDNSCESLVEYLRAFEIIGKVLQTAPNLTRTMFECCEDAYLDGCTYVEFRFAPVLHLSGGLTYNEVMNAVIAGIEAAQEKYDIVVRIIICAMRHLSAEKSLEAAKIAVEYKGNYVVGFDLAGPENGFMPSIHKEACELCYSNGVKITIHAGEAAGYESVDDAVMCHASRLGHGVRSLENKDTIKRLIDNHVVLECCLTSNLQTKAITSFSEHPLVTLMEKGICCTVNTDNTTVSSCSLSGENMLVNQLFGLSNQQVAELTLNSFKAAFIEDENIRNNLIQDCVNKMKSLKVIA